MNKNEIEIVKYPKIKHIKMFVNEIKSVENHIHNDFEIFVVLKNMGVARINSKLYELKKGDIFFINSSDVHSLSSKMTEDNKILNPTFLLIQVSNHFIRDYFPQIQTTVFKSQNLKDILSKENYQIVLKLLINSAINYFSSENYYQLDVIADISKFFSYIYKYNQHEIISEVQKQKLRKRNNRIERIISYIDANFDSQIRIEDITSSENMTVTHFSHLFTSTFGMTFQEYISIKRMEQSIRLMANKEKTLIEISFESGFSDPKYMNKIFLKKYGCTAKEYRKKYLDYNNDLIENKGKFEKIYSDCDALQEVKLFLNNMNSNC